VVEIDFSSPAIAAAQDLATELGMTERTKFIESIYMKHPKRFLNLDRST
jgi:hypothetical protein